MILIVNWVINYIAAKKSIAMGGAAAGATSVIIIMAANAYTDKSIAEKVTIEREKREAWQKAREKYGDDILLEIRRHMERQDQWDQRHFQELIEIHKEIRKK